MELDKSLVSGSMALLVMKLLEGQDMYGYQMIEELKRRSDDTFHLKAGSLYPLLHGLEEPYKEVFHLRVFGELPFGDIARVFGRTESWARVTFYRAKQKIIAGLEEEKHGG